LAGRQDNKKDPVGKPDRPGKTAVGTHYRMKCESKTRKYADLCITFTLFGRR
jgi:hypothetical protein